jgi:hypothetical protein
MRGPKGRRVRQALSLSEIDIAFIDEPLVFDAEDFVSGCQHCDEAAAIPFDYLLDALTGSDPSTTEYLMQRLGQCPRCFGEITEKSLVSVEPVRSRTAE